MNTKTLIFDFDGTLADTHHHIIEISNRLADEFGYGKILPEDIDSFKRQTSQEVIKRLKVPIMKIPAILVKAKKEFQKGIDQLESFPGVKETLNTLKSKGISLGILSSNNPENIHTFLNNHQMDVFDFIHSTSKVWSKHTCLKKVIKEKHLLEEDVIYIGDEIRDILASKKLKLKVAAVAWGYNHISTLQEYQPDFLIQKPEELLDLIQ